MNKKFSNFMGLLVVMVIVCTLVALAAVPARAAAIISLSKSSGIVGTSVTVKASGFGGDAVLITKFDGVAMVTAPSTVITSTAGAVTFYVLTPQVSEGLHTISVTDGVNTATAPYTIQPKVVITSPASKGGPMGTNVTVAGTGFSGIGVTADVTIGGVSLASGVLVDSTGSFTATGTVSSMAPGNQVISATDNAGNVAVESDIFTVIPTMILFPSSGLPGAAVTLTGNGWPASSSVTVTLEGGSPVSFSADGNGLINSTYTIPVSAIAGVKIITGTSGAITATTTLTVLPAPTPPPKNKWIYIGGPTAGFVLFACASAIVIQLIRRRHLEKQRIERQKAEIIDMIDTELKGK